ncbi:Uroporphyrinogen decarboxylase (URO-D) [Sporobacter termitidis DSM 10068]|uniref:Uroporphyrinogen decarboxylase (URO-D) n=1 Tax=Sporobacter termitidis DSM 10068 TaxID=1123282 RepID=A0A1M5XE48_9FIRM|nr:uroporphyrinogen decarboxylase family protein [Sporobacter termitidis]SHH98029.1 Uroporphyrinogen decarboxylase (URO-D) [Sporobacter termitidis DSM 10068]
MNRRIPYVPGELRVVDTLPGFFGGPGFPLRDTPVTPHENMAALFYDKHPYWLPLPGDSTFMIPALYNERLGRGGPAGVTDVFGIEWEWVESAGGSIVRPGEPLLKNANEWTDKIKIPDIDMWDWVEEAGKTTCDRRVSTQMSFINGFWFERLVSFMDFAPAAMALIDDDQKDAVKALFADMTDLACKLVDKFCEYWPGLDGFNIHDDWAAQRAPFFSAEVARELFVPYMKALTDHIHARGRYVTLHSCGRGETRVQCFIDGGFDGWDPQAMNDTHRLWDEVGDKICISVVPDAYDPAAISEDEQRRRGREFAQRFCRPGRPAQLGFYAGAMLTKAFTDEVYIASRKIYSSQTD